MHSKIDCSLQACSELPILIKLIYFGVKNVKDSLIKKIEMGKSCMHLIADGENMKITYCRTENEKEFQNIL